MRYIRPALVQVIGVVLLSPLGCAGTGMMSWMRDDMPKANAKNPAVKIVCIWEPAEGQFDKLPTRGFAGQIFFFTRHSTPAQVDGAVRVYLFGDQGSIAEQGKPIHQFDFPADVWAAHLSKSMLGPSYNVFVPYVGRQPWQANCSLRVRFTPENGPTIYSDMVHVILPGPDKKTQSQPSQAAGLQIDERTNDLASFSLGATLKRQQSPVSPSVSRPLHLAPMAAEQLAPNEEPRLENAHTTRPDITLRPNVSRQLSATRHSKPANDTSDGRSQQFQRSIQQPNQAHRQPKADPTPESAAGKPRRFRMVPAQADAGSGFDQSDSAGSTTNPQAERRLQTSPHPLQDFKKRVHPLAQD